MKSTLVLTFLLLFSSVSNAQDSTGVIRGVIYDSETGEPVIFAKIYLLDEDSVVIGGQQSDFDGLFIISRVTPGAYTLLIREIEHHDLTQEVVLKPKAIVTKTFEMDKPRIQEIEIQSYKEIHKLSPADIIRVPVIKTD